jgi:5-methyltetrahydropteroyltriglutamate--homocysteine methyltransferase
MKERPIRTTVIGSYPFPGWLLFASQHLDQFGKIDIDEIMEDAVTAAVSDQVAAGLDVITDGEQTRFDFNLSFYGYINGIEENKEELRKWGPPAHDQRGKNFIVGELAAPKGLGVVEEFNRLKRLVPNGPVLKASIPGPYTLSGRLVPNDQYADRFAITEALLPFVRKELEDLIEAGCTEITVDEPSMSCYAYKEDTKRFVDIFNKGHAVGYRKIAPMLPDFLDFHVDEVHVEMTNREFVEVELISRFAEKMDVAVGVVDVKSYYIETIKDVEERIKRCLEYISADKLSVAPDCGLSQTARWASRKKLTNMVLGAQKVRGQL